MGATAWQETIARERIALLFAAAAEAFPERPDRADRYVALARRIGERVTVPIPDRFKDRFCRDCGAYLVAGENARIRLGDGHKRVTCERCGAVRRVPYQD